MLRSPRSASTARPAGPITAPLKRPDAPTAGPCVVRQAHERLGRPATWWRFLRSTHWRSSRSWPGPRTSRPPPTNSGSVNRQWAVRSLCWRNTWASSSSPANASA